MKQFIVLLAVLPLMMIFLVQFTLDQQIEAKRAIIDSLVYTAKEEARQAGCFNEEIVTRLKENIAEKCKVLPKDIAVNADASPKPRASKSNVNWNEDLIHYQVKVTLGAIMAGGKLLGIDTEDNIYCYVIDSYAASENIEIE